MTQHYTYYDLEGIPCRVEDLNGEDGDAQMYRTGTGFVPGPKTDILFHGVPISKQAFDAMIFALIRPARA